MRSLTSRKTLNSKSDVQKEYIKELCFQTPFLVINTPCGIGKYKFNKIGYDKDDALILEYTLIKDRKYTFLVIGNKELVDHSALKQLGEYQELTLEDLFGY